MAILWNPTYYRWHPRKKTIKHQENAVPEICSVHSSNEIKGAQPFTPVSLAVKMNTLGLERRLSGKEHLLLFWRLKFSSRHPHQLTLPVTLAPGSHASGFHGHLHSRAHTQTYTHTIKLIKVSLKMNVLVYSHNKPTHTSDLPFFTGGLQWSENLSALGILEFLSGTQATVPHGSASETECTDLTLRHWGQSNGCGMGFCSLGF